ncbi:methyltransferase domain-containing protein [Chitinophaga sp.]|uniref:class I SAM-dependent methyltransferase n=1 Tax=Chitinophaga sp. TaxID=1869181 RepID=UPI0031DB344D
MKNFVNRLKEILSPSLKFDTSSNYWEQRYKRGKNSGDGSYGRLANFKAEVINRLVKENQCTSAIELGCGDGNQLSLIDYPRYVGLDISESVIKKCREQFQSDKTKRFYTNTKENIANLKKENQFDIALSIDVIYHLVEQSVYEEYLRTLFELSGRWIVIYSTNFEQQDAAHVLHRKFTDWVSQNQPGWSLIDRIENPYPGTGHQESLADFYVFKKT